MFFHFSRPRRQWKLRYTFLYHGNEIQEDDRFLTRAEAEERFQTMCAYHTNLQQPITSAQLYGPKGFHADLTQVSQQLHASSAITTATTVVKS